jgi:hypothetical protein
MKKTIGLVFLAVWIVVLPGMAQELLFTGIVKDKDTRKELGNVNISVNGTNIGTVSNSEGVFSLKTSRTEVEKGITFSHIGYLNTHLHLKNLEEGKMNTVWLEPSPLSLHEVNVFGGNPLELVMKALRNISSNYADTDNLFSVFYRETVQKGQRFIGISEAVMDVYKTDYKVRDVYQDRVQVQKGRRLASQKKSDTLAVKIASGPLMHVYMDVVKNPDGLLDEQLLPCYAFRMESPVVLDNRLQYVISFRPIVSLDYALYKGTLYIDQESLAFTRAMFELDLSDKEKAIHSILQKKPAGLHFKPQLVTFLITYRIQNGKSYLNYLRNEMRFKCDWKKRLFSSSFTTTTEMVMVDREDNPANNIKYRDSFKRREVFYDVVEEYWNEDFWKDYNIIEPTESLESAVKKLKKQKR